MYLLFAGQNYYPSGGWDDFRGCFGTIELAQEHAMTLKIDWWHIASINGGIVSHGNGPERVY